MPRPAKLLRAWTLKRVTPLHSLFDKRPPSTGRAFFVTVFLHLFTSGALLYIPSQCNSLTLQCEPNGLLLALGHAHALSLGHLEPFKNQIQIDSLFLCQSFRQMFTCSTVFQELAMLGMGYFPRITGHTASRDRGPLIEYQ